MYQLNWNVFHVDDHLNIKVEYKTASLNINRPEAAPSKPLTLPYFRIQPTHLDTVFYQVNLGK